jgi:shikimate kinase
MQRSVANGCGFAICHSSAKTGPSMARRSIARDSEVIRRNLGARPIVLVGLMCAGKTSGGRRLAEKLNINFVDADHEIELAAGKPITEIFADHGETYFREGERRVIARLMDNGSQVLATGGGAWMNSDTREKVKERGISIWLKADLHVLLRRVAKRNDRPLLREDPEGVLRKLIDQRYPFYATADVTVESRDVQHGQMVNDVVKALADWPGLEIGDDE